jgi:hypothetical protein
VTALESGGRIAGHGEEENARLTFSSFLFPLFFFSFSAFRNQPCSGGDAESSEQASFACICTQSNADELGKCGTCILSNTAEPSTSESAAVALQLALSITRSCGIMVNIDGTSPAISSALANGADDYASERASLTATDGADVYTTNSGGMAVTATRSPSSSATSSSSGGSVSNTGSASSSAASASSTSPTSAAPASHLLSGSLFVITIVGIAVALV